MIEVFQVIAMAIRYLKLPRAYVNCYRTLEIGGYPRHMADLFHEDSGAYFRMMGRWRRDVFTCRAH